MDIQMRTNVDIEGDSRSAPQVSVTSRAAVSPALPATGSHPHGRTHVLFLIDQLCGIGGAERSLLNILRFLPRDRFRCSVVTFKADPAWSGFENFPCDWWHFPLQRTYDWNALKVALRLRRLIRSQKVDIVHTFFETSDIWGGMVAKLSGAPVLISSRRDMGILRNAMHRFAYRALGPLFDLVLTVSEEVRTFCIQHDHLKPEKVLTLHNAIELEMIPSASPAVDLRNSMGLGHASHLICTIGHVRRIKGVDVLVRAAKRVCAEFPRAVFLVIGGVLEPDHLQELQGLIESLDLKENVKFLGPSEDVLPLLAMSDVYCLASRSEGFSNALLEAMACGLPCVATRVGGNPEAVEDGRSGFLIESEDIGALADRIRTLLRQPERAKEMGRQGRRIIEAKFTIPVMISRLVEVYDIAQ
jgi:glycosyltransferase involved in cell wall biosynthesis